MISRRRFLQGAMTSVPVLATGVITPPALANIPAQPAYEEDKFIELILKMEKRILCSTSLNQEQARRAACVLNLLNHRE